MPCTLPEGDVTSSNATDPTTTILIRDSCLDSCLWSFELDLLLLLQVFSQNQLQLFSCRRGDLFLVGKNCVRQGRAALAGASCGHGCNGFPDYSCGIFGVLYQHG